MISSGELSELLADLYAAPLQPKRWQAFFDRLCTLTNIASGFMLSVHPQEGNLVLAGGGLNFDPEIFHLYNEHYGANDPFAEPATRNRRVGVIQGEELVSRADFLKSEIYNDLLAQYDLGHMTLMSCNSSTQGVDAFPLWSSPKQGPMNAASLHLLQTLIPHVQTALHLRTKIAASNTSKLFSEAALDAIKLAVFLVNGNGRVLHMNRRAETYIQSANGLRVHNGRLTASDPGDSAKLELLVAGATATGRNGFNVAPGGAMKISRYTGRYAPQISVVPSPNLPDAVGIAEGSCALVFVSDQSGPHQSRAALLRQLYGLTPTESHLADLLLQGLEVSEIANRLTITIGTARFHLKRVLAKTDSRRQAELMRLMLSLPDQ